MLSKGITQLVLNLCEKCYQVLGIFFCPLQRTKKVFVDWWLVTPQMNYVTSGDDLQHFQIELVSVELG